MLSLLNLNVKEDCFTHLTVLARLKGAEKRANTTPSMVKLTREEKMTCVHGVCGVGSGHDAPSAHSLKLGAAAASCRRWHDQPPRPPASSTSSHTLHCE